MVTGNTLLRQTTICNLTQKEIINLTLREHADNWLACELARRLETAEAEIERLEQFDPMYDPNYPG